MSTCALLEPDFELTRPLTLELVEELKIVHADAHILLNTSSNVGPGQDRGDHMLWQSDLKCSYNKLPRVTKRLGQFRVELGKLITGKASAQETSIVAKQLYEYMTRLLDEKLVPKWYLETFHYEQAISAWYDSQSLHRQDGYGRYSDSICIGTGPSTFDNNPGTHHTRIMRRMGQVLPGAGEVGWVFWLYDVSRFQEWSSRYNLLTKHIPELDSYYTAYLVGINSEHIDQALIDEFTPYIRNVPHYFLNCMWLHGPDLVIRHLDANEYHGQPWINHDECQYALIANDGGG